MGIEPKPVVWDRHKEWPLPGISRRSSKDCFWPFSACGPDAAKPPLEELGEMTRISSGTNVFVPGSGLAR